MFILGEPLIKSLTEEDIVVVGYDETNNCDVTDYIDVHLVSGFFHIFCIFISYNLECNFIIIICQFLTSVLIYYFLNVNQESDVEDNMDISIVASNAKPTSSSTSTLEIISAPVVPTWSK